MITVHRWECCGAVMGRKAKLAAPSCRPGSRPACVGSAGHPGIEQVSTCFPIEDEGSSSLSCRVAQAPSALLCSAELLMVYHILHGALDEDIGTAESSLSFPVTHVELRSSFHRGFLLSSKNRQFLPETSPLTTPWEILLSLEMLGGLTSRTKAFGFVLAGFKLCGTMMVS